MEVRNLLVFVVMLITYPLINYNGFNYGKLSEILDKYLHNTVRPFDYFDHIKGYYNLSRKAILCCVIVYEEKKNL